MDIDYSKMSAADLEDAAAHIDREKFPERASEIDRQLARRRADPPLPARASRPVSAKTWITVGFVIAMTGVVVFLLGMILGTVGLYEVGTGLGFGLAYWALGGIGAFAIAIGAILDLTRSHPKSGRTF